MCYIRNVFVCYALLIALALHSSSANSSTGEDRCFTHLLEAHNTDIDMTAGDGQPGCTALHTNTRVVHASAPVNHGGSVLLLCSYADAPDTLLLSRYALGDGALLDSVQLADRSASAPAPAAMCATSYDVFTLEADGTLRHYSRQTGNSAPLLDASAQYRALACTDDSVYAIDALTALVLQLDPADGLVLHVLLRLPAATALYVGADDTTLQVELGWPAAFVLHYDLQRAVVTAFSAVVTAVSTDALPAPLGALCALQRIDAVTGRRSTTYTQLAADCKALQHAVSSYDIDVVVAEGVAWHVSATTGRATPVTGALLNNGNLGAPLALASAGVSQFVALDSSGRLARFSVGSGGGDKCDTTLVTRMPLLPRARAVLALSDYSAVWLDLDGAVWVRTPLDAATDIQLPALGGAVFDAVVRDDGPSPSAVCVLMASLTHCFALNNPRVTATVTLPSVLSANIQQVRLVDADGTLLLVEAQQQQAAHGGIALWYDGEQQCELRVSRAPVQADTFEVLEYEDGMLALRWSADTVRLVHVYNCSVDERVVLVSDTGAHLALLESSSSGSSGGDASKKSCLFGSRHGGRHRSSAPSLFLFHFLGLMFLLVACCTCVYAAVTMASEVRALRRAGEPSGGQWSQHSHHSKRAQVTLGDHAWLQPLYGTEAQCCVHALCCCLPAVRQRIVMWQDQRRRYPVADEPEQYYSGTTNDPIAASISTTASTASYAGSAGASSSLAAGGGETAPFHDVHID